jgi:hypothetical protein
VIRSACGALIEPQDILFGTRRVRPGEVFEDGSVTYYFSRAMHVLVGRLDCEAGAQTTSSYVEWLEVHRDDR